MATSTIAGRSEETEEEEMNDVGVNMDKAQSGVANFVLEMTIHFKTPLEGDSLGAATIWVHWLRPSVPSLQ